MIDQQVALVLLPTPEAVTIDRNNGFSVQQGHTEQFTFRIVFTESSFVTNDFGPIRNWSSPLDGIPALNGLRLPRNCRHCFRGHHLRSPSPVSNVFARSFSPTTAAMAAPISMATLWAAAIGDATGLATFTASGGRAIGVKLPIHHVPRCEEYIKDPSGISCTYQVQRAEVSRNAASGRALPSVPRSKRVRRPCNSVVARAGF